MVKQELENIEVQEKEEEAEASNVSTKGLPLKGDLFSLSVE